MVLLDIDPQRSLTRWHAIRMARTRPAAAIALSDVSGWRLSGERDRLRRDFDVLIVDSPLADRHRCPPGRARGGPRADPGAAPARRISGPPRAPSRWPRPRSARWRWC
ncbi:MAG: hypothetical protein WDN49_04180 [Acetobacteraceae bacterium]